MAKAATRPEARTIDFVGPPRRMVALEDTAGLAADAEIAGPLAGYLAPGRAAFRAGGRRPARLRLAPTTPPGRYDGTLTAGKETWTLTAQVLPETRVSVLAGSLDFTGPAGEPAEATLVFANEGNTTIEMPKLMPVGLFDDDGIETAFAALYAKQVTALDGFVETLLGKLGDAHSGLLKLAVTRGHGPHPPGSRFVAEFRLDLGAGLKAGHRYHGVASTDFADLAITLSISNGAKS